MIKTNPCKLIELNNVKKHFLVDKVVIHALNGVSFDIYEGELLVILGASGSGKSTLLSLIGGMDRPTEGSIIFDNHDMAAFQEKEFDAYRRKTVGFVFQFFNLIHDLTIRENIALGSGLSVNSKEIESVLDDMGLAHKKHSFPSQLSGGQQQRISIARAIVKRPALLLCDEPIGSLDYETGKSILKILENICRQMGCTVVIVTHNSSLERLADRVIKMKNGLVKDIIKNEKPVSSEEIDW